MSEPDHLRAFARQLLRIASDCFDLHAAERLRLLSEQMQANANERDDASSLNRSLGLLWPKRAGGSVRE